jgi:hypothetical protein
MLLNILYPQNIVYLMINHFIIFFAKPVYTKRHSFVGTYISGSIIINTQEIGFVGCKKIVVFFGESGWVS